VDRPTDIRLGNAGVSSGNGVVSSETIIRCPRPGVEEPRVEEGPRQESDDEEAQKEVPFQANRASRQVHVKVIRASIVAPNQGNCVVRHGDRHVPDVRGETGRVVGPRFPFPGAVHGGIRHQQHRARGTVASDNFDLRQWRSAGERGTLRAELVRHEDERHVYQQREQDQSSDFQVIHQGQQSDRSERIEEIG